MLYKFIFILIFLIDFVPCESKAQNLVNNGSFENFTDCTNAQLFNATGWCGVGRPQFGIMTTCQPDPLFTVPRQLFSWFDSYQIPRTGNSYGFYQIYNQSLTDAYQGLGQIKLNQTLVANKNYCVTYYISSFNNSIFTVDKLGSYLTATPFICVSTSTTQIKGLYTPQVFSQPGVQLDDTLGWMEISGVITATGIEDYLVIGDFFLEAQHSIVNSYPTNINGVAEYYVDDVSVEEVQLANCKNDTSICLGDSVLLGNNVSEATIYNWLPTIGLSCNTCANPKAKPLSTTTYTCFKTQCKANTNDEITITVKTCTNTAIKELQGITFIDGILINIHPNPTNSILYIKDENNQLKHSIITISNTLGEVVLSQGFSTQIDLSKLASGMYYLTMEQGGNKKTVKIVKE